MLNIRIDDFPCPSIKPNEIGLFTLESFKKFHAVFEKYQKNYVLGCVPLYTKDEDLMWFAKQPLIEVAMHGVSHNEDHPNEFPDWVPEEDIIKTVFDIKEKWDSLLGYGVNVYIPPHNEISSPTCRALQNLGFETILGGPGTDLAVFKYAREQLSLNCHYSSAPMEYGRSDEMLQRGSVKYIKENIHKKDIWLTLHFTWEFNCSNGTFNHLDKYFQELFS